MIVKLKTSLNIAGVFLAALLMLGVASIYLAPHFGWQVDNIGSGSMAPELRRGTLIIARPVASHDVAVGDIITFWPIVGRNMMCHRVIGIQDSPVRFQTKGDADALPDPNLVPSGNLVGLVIFHVALLGYVAQFLKTLPGLFLGLVAPGLLIFWMCLSSFRDAVTKER